MDKLELTTQFLLTEFPCWEETEEAKSVAMKLLEMIDEAKEADGYYRGYNTGFDEGREVAYKEVGEWLDIKADYLTVWDSLPRRGLSQDVINLLKQGKSPTEGK